MISPLPCQPVSCSPAQLRSPSSCSPCSPADWGTRTSQPLPSTQELGIAQQTLQLQQPLMQTPPPLPCFLVSSRLPSCCASTFHSTSLYRYGYQRLGTSFLIRLYPLFEFHFCHLLACCPQCAFSHFHWWECWQQTPLRHLSRSAHAVETRIRDSLWEGRWEEETLKLETPSSLD